MKAMMKKPAVKKPKFAMGGMAAAVNAGIANRQQEAAAAQQQQAAQQQRAARMAAAMQQQTRAAPAPRARIPAPVGRGRAQVMMAKGGAVKGKKK